MMVRFGVVKEKSVNQLLCEVWQGMAGMSGSGAVSWGKSVTVR